MVKGNGERRRTTAEGSGRRGIPRVGGTPYNNGQRQTAKADGKTQLENRY